MSDQDLREQVRTRYAAAAAAVLDHTVDTPLSSGGSGGCCSPRPTSTCCSPSLDVVGHFGPELYSPGERAELPDSAVEASLGCGNPVMVAELRAGETVLDLGSGGGIDVLLSARRVGPTGFAYGVDMTDEMLELANQNKTVAGLTNVEFLKGTIEALPLPDGSVDVVISNCVINLSVDKPAVLAEMFRVLKPGGRIGVADVVADDHLTAAERAERGSYVSCIAGAMSQSEYLEGLGAAGFVDASVEFTSEVAPGMHSALIRAAKAQS